MALARIENGKIIEILQSRAGVSVKDLYHADIISACEHVIDGASVGDVLVDGEWVTPEEPVSEAPVTEEPAPEAIAEEPVA